MNSTPIRPGRTFRPSVDECGLPLKPDVVTLGVLDAHNSLGENSNNRSVRMPSLAPPPLISQTSIGYSKIERYPSGEFTMMPPPLTKSFIGSYDSDSSCSPLPNELDLSASFWKVDPETVRCKPDFHTLDPMSKMIMNSNAQSIANRISDCLHRRSIFASFGKSKPKARCFSPDGVEFSIAFYAGKKQYTGGIIVEIQRMHGWATSYFQDCHAIMESAECDNIGDSDNFFDGSMPSLCKEDLCSSENNASKSRLSLPKLLLFSTRQETMMLGLESICTLTDSRKYGYAAALSTARALFLDKENEAMKDFLYDLLILQRWKNESLSDLPKQTQNAVSHQAIVAISNSTCVLSKGGFLRDVLKVNAWMENEFVSILKNYILRPSSGHYIASLSVKCMNDIARN